MNRTLSNRVLFVSTSIVRFSSIIAQSVLPLYAYSLNITPFYISIIIAILWVFNGIGSLLINVSKKVNNFIVMSFLITLMGFILIIFSKNFFYLIISVSLVGLGLGSISILLAPSMHIDNKGFEGIGLYSFALSLGLILGTLFSSIILSYLSFFYIFIFTAILLIIPISLALKYKFNRHDFKLILKFNIIFSIMRNKKFSKYFILNFIYSFTLPLIISYWGIYEENSVKLKSNIVMLSLFLLFLTSSIIRFKSIKSSEKNLVRQETVAILVLPISFILLNIHNIYINILALLLFAIPHSILYPTFLYNAYKSLNKNNIIAGNLLFSASSGIAEFLSPIFALGIINMFTIKSLFLFALPISFLMLIFYFK
ncbi:MFS transporter [Caldisphaera sp.]|uniref:MFS transporter n=1 Tax=Caldisphaera sp. TaxID=2060322 RepID=UPI0025C29E2A|nr:MFS transporter [Caldisphaera sp.]